MNKCCPCQIKKKHFKISMAATIFRGSCALYWVTWLVSLSYVLGISIYESKYVVLSDSYSSSVLYVKASCYLILSFSIVGCIFVKCDVSHMVCFLMYVLPVLIIIPTMCVVSIMKVRTVMEDTKSEAFLNKTMAILLRKFKEVHVKSGHNHFPSWLERNEFDNKCCGIRDWRDYVTLFEKEIPNSTHSKDALFPVPRTCCCRSKNLSEYDFLRFQRYPHPSITPSNIIHNKGCGKVIIDEFETLKNSHIIFMVILIFSSLGMLIVYVKSWCSSRPWNGGSSDHSLDVERVSLLDFGTEDPTRGSSIDTPGRKSIIALRGASKSISGKKSMSKPLLPPKPSVAKAPSTAPGALNSKYKKFASMT